MGRSVANESAREKRKGELIFFFCGWRVMYGKVTIAYTRGEASVGVVHITSVKMHK
jgi:hypothetical protein